MSCLYISEREREREIHHPTSSLLSVSLKHPWFFCARERSGGGERNDAETRGVGERGGGRARLRGGRVGVHLGERQVQGLCQVRRAALRVPAHGGVRVRHRGGGARAGRDGHRHRGQRLLRPLRRRRPGGARPEALRRRHHSLGGGPGGGAAVRVRRVAELRRDERPDEEQKRVALQPHLPLRLRRAQGRRLRDGVRGVRRRHGLRDRRLRQHARRRAGARRRDGAAAAAVGVAPVPAARAEPVRAAGLGRRDGAAAVAVPARGLPGGSPPRVRRRLRRQATRGHGLTLPSVPG